MGEGVWKEGLDGAEEGAEGQLWGRRRVRLHVPRLGAMGPAARTAHGQGMKQRDHAVAKANSLESVRRIMICDSHDRKGWISVTRVFSV